MEGNKYEHFFDSLLQWTQMIKSTYDKRFEKSLVLQKIKNFEKDLRHLREKQILEYEKILSFSKRADEIFQEILNEIDAINNSRNESNDQKVEIGEHKLPDLPYEYNALEPYINEEIMRLHHSEHHKGYVEGLNKAEKEMAKARQKRNYDLIKHWQREVAFNGAGHYLHTIFWNVMSPDGGGNPISSLAKQIETDFGSFAKFKEHFSKAANKVEAVGWAILVWSPRSRRLEILQAEKHQNLSQWDVIPILPLDVWEHAYYLQYKNKRDLYVDNWWNVVNWEHANERFEKAKELTWEPF